MEKKVLIADDDLAFARRLSTTLAAHDWRVEVVSTSDELLGRLGRESVPYLSVEPNLPGRPWHGVLSRIGHLLRDSSWVVATSFPSRALTETALRAGAHAVFSKPVDAKTLELELLRTATSRAADESPERPEYFQFLASTRLAPMSLNKVEWEYMNEVLARCEGNMCAAARELGIPRQTLYRKLRTHPPPR